MKICCVVVTYNRLELLKLTIEKLLNQSFELNSIIIIDNASNDGTKEYLEQLDEKKFVIISLNKNIGGAGGFNEGLKYAYNNKYDYIWIMDDDTITIENSLERLIDGINILKGQNIGFVCSNVLYKDNKPCLMNISKPEEVWNEFSEFGITKIKSASFVSLLINRKVIEELGLPIKEFFIWGDDLEYTKRINKKYDCYMIGSSIVYHYMKENLGVSIVETENRVERYFYEFRNKFYIAKNGGTKEILKYIIYVTKMIIRILKKSKKFKIKKLLIVLKGIIYGVTFNPSIEYLKK